MVTSLFYLAYHVCALYFNNSLFSVHTVNILICILPFINMPVCDRVVCQVTDNHHHGDLKFLSLTFC